MSKRSRLQRALARQRVRSRGARTQGGAAATAVASRPSRSAGLTRSTKRAAGWAPAAGSTAHCRRAGAGWRPQGRTAGVLQRRELQGAASSSGVGRRALGGGRAGGGRGPVTRRSRTCADAMTCGDPTACGDPLACGDRIRTASGEPSPMVCGDAVARDAGTPRFAATSLSACARARMRQATSFKDASHRSEECAAQRRRHDVVPGQICAMSPKCGGAAQAGVRGPRSEQRAPSPRRACQIRCPGFAFLRCFSSFSSCSGTPCPSPSRLPLADPRLLLLCLRVGAGAWAPCASEMRAR